MNELPKRKQIRLTGYNYSQNGLYFVTICTQNREYLFGSIVGADQCVRPPIPDQCVIKLNDIGKMINKWILKIPENFVNACLDIYQIMPNHIHLIIVIKQTNRGSNGSTHGLNNGSTHGSTPTSLGNMVQWFKTMSTNEYINGIKNYNWPPFNKRLFQRNYGVYPERSRREHIIRNEQELYKIQEYIKLNPMVWERDRNNPNHI